MADDSPTVNLAAKFGAKIKGLTQRASTAEKERDELRTQNAALVKERDDARGAVLTPDAKDKRIADLTAKIRDGAHRATFATLAKAAGAHETGLDDLYQLSGHKAETDEPDADALKALVEDLKTQKPLFFGKPGEAAPPAPPEKKPIPGQGRGSAHNGGDGTLIGPEQRSDPKFMLNPANREVIAAAAREGRFR